MAPSQAKPPWRSPSSGVHMYASLVVAIAKVFASFSTERKSRENPNLGINQEPCSRVNTSGATTNSSSTRMIVIAPGHLSSL